MKKILVALAISAAVITPAFAQRSHSVGGYTKNNGTYVAPHVQTNPNSTKLDNYSTKGNVNPYTGKVGTVDPYKSSSSTTPR